jgi:hypothetical protein
MDMADHASIRESRAEREALLYGFSWDGYPVPPPISIEIRGPFRWKRLTQEEAEKYHLKMALKSIGTTEQIYHLREAFYNRIWRGFGGEQY